MTRLNKGTQKYNNAVWAWWHCDYGTIEQAYAKPSVTKRQTYNDIWFRAMQTEGYNHDLKVTGRSSTQYSTMYSFTRNGICYVVWDTRLNTYIFELQNVIK